MRISDIETLRSLLELREHDVERLHAEHAGFLLWIYFLLSAGLVEAAQDAVWRRLS